jgi:hypothetical protein
MPSAPRVTLKFPASWTALQPCGRQLGSFTLISPGGERAAITKAYPVYITNDTSAVGTAGSISGNIIPAIDFSDLPSLDATSTPGDTKAVLNEVLRRLKACCITLAMVLAVPFFASAAEVKTAPLDDVAGTTPVVTNVSFEGLAKTTDVATLRNSLHSISNRAVNSLGVNISYSPYIKKNVFSVTNNLHFYGKRYMYFNVEDDEPISLYSEGDVVVRGANLYISDWDDFRIEGDKAWPEYEQSLPDYISETISAAVVPAPAITNIVRDVQGLVYDEKLGITWKQTMFDGNLYYIAVTNANVTEVK